jgi:transposase
MGWDFGSSPRRVTSGFCCRWICVTGCRPIIWVWFVLDVVERLDLGEFHRAYRADGHGRAAYDPALMVALLLYAYCTGVRSSRAIEQRCVQDIAYRVLAGGLCPDHVTIARFRSRHAAALAAVFVASLRLCAEAGLVRLGIVALDGTKIGANASRDANRTLDALTQQINRPDRRGRRAGPGRGRPGRQRRHRRR